MDLRELQKNYLDNLRKVTEDKLEIGSLVRTVISIEEGLVFKDGRKQKPKKLVIIGVDKVKKVCYGSVLVNTKMMVSTSNPSHAFPIIKLYKAPAVPIPSKLRNVSSDPQFEEWVVERYGISIHCSTEFKWIFYHNRFFFRYY